MDVLVPALIVIGSAMAGFVVRRIGRVVAGAVVASVVVGSTSLALTDADLHMDGLGVLFVLAVVAVLSATGAGVGVLLRHRSARPSP